MYINIETNQYPVSEQEIRDLNPNTSFPVPFTPTEHYEYVFPAPHPEYDPNTQFVQEIAPELSIKGSYEQQWVVLDLPQENIDAIAEEIRKIKLQQTISMRQARLALHQLGILDDVETAIQSSDRNIQITWEYDITVVRGNGLVQKLTELLSWDDAKLDEIFELAFTL